MNAYGHWIAEAGVSGPYQPIEDPDALRAQLEAELAGMRSPFPTAEAFGIEEIIDPRETRPLLVAWARRAYEIVCSARGPTARGLRP